MIVPLEDLKLLRKTHTDPRALALIDLQIALARLDAKGVVKARISEVLEELTRDVRRHPLTLRDALKRIQAARGIVSEAGLICDFSNVAEARNALGTIVVPNPARPI